MKKVQNVYEAVIESNEIYHSFTVTKNSQGYGWVIKCAGADIDEIKKRVVELDEFCKMKYGA